MINVLFSFQGRINRAKVWLAFLAWIVISAVAGAIIMAVMPAIPADGGEEALASMGGALIPAGVVGFIYVIVAVWSGLAIGIKRFHDRDKSGWWVLIQFVPIVGPIWYFVEVFCLRGTPGPNRFGLDPLQM
ncbi:DUF805 domain-containing protein [Methyloraptor flagellatus]|uniref:DUF805 domain-containing protein n=1 Tax=Methyloraptor flagellatus TaxID=3162530 RepID=A0AAU7X9L5_9HYPH